MGVQLRLSASGASWGSLDDTATLLEAARELVSLGLSYTISWVLVNCWGLSMGFIRTGIYC